MSTVLQHKRSSVLGSIPTTSDLALGEIAINTRDGKAFLKRDVSGTQSVVELLGFDTRTAADLVTNNTFTGNGTTVTFTGLSQVPASANHTVVTINGVVQEPIGNYTVLNDTITFLVAPASGDAIEVRTFAFVVKTVNLVDYGFYEYEIASTVNTVTGLDRNYKTLLINPLEVAVFLNGVKLKIGSDFTATAGTITFAANLVSGDFVEVQSYSKLTLNNLTGQTFDTIEFESNASNSSNVVSSTIAGANIIDSFLKADFRSAKYLVQVTSGTDYHSAELLVIHNGTTVYMTQYASVFDNVELATFDADIASGYLRLLATPTNTGSSIRVYRTALRV
jgi:hypothetical protein